MPENPTLTRMGAGLAAVAMSLGVSQLAAAFFSPAADARTSVGTAVINLTPGPVKEWAIQTFGTSDKTFLTVMVIVVIVALVSVAAIWERSRIPLGSLAIAAAAVAGCAAVLARPGATLPDVIPTVLGAAAGIAVLRLLTAPRVRNTEPEPGLDPGRRRSLLTLGFVGLGALSGVGGTVLTRQRRSVAGDREAFY